MEEHNEAKKRQKRNIIMGILLFPISIFLIVKLSGIIIPGGQIYIKSFKDVFRIIFSMNLILLVAIPMLLLLTGLSSYFDRKNNSYLRLNHMIILILKVLKALIAFDMLGVFGLSCEFIDIHIKEFLIFIYVWVLIIFFILNDDNLRWIYFRILKIFKMEDKPYDNRYKKHSKLYYNIFKPKPEYKQEIKNDDGTYKYISNSIDQFRLGQTSDFKIWGIPILPKSFKHKSILMIILLIILVFLLLL